MRWSLEDGSQRNEVYIWAVIEDVISFEDVGLPGQR